MALLGGTAGWVRGLGLGEESVRDQRVAARQACGRVDRGVDGLRRERLGRWERGSSGLVEQGVDADGDDDGGGLREGVAFLVSFLVALQVSFGCCGTARGRKCGVVTGRWQGVVRRGHGGRGASSRPVVEVLQPNPTLQTLLLFSNYANVPIHILLNTSNRWPKPKHQSIMHNSHVQKRATG